MGDTVGGRYELGGRLGEGGMGEVYRARHVELDRPVAVKLLAPAFALDGAARARFQEAARLASQVSHPNIVSVVDFGEDPHVGAYLVMELVEGEPLVTLRGPLPIRRACDVLAQIASALDHIHARGIVHGDVKADNILLTVAGSGPSRRYVARLLDFGLARRPGGDDDTSSISGSPHYLAPERAAGAPPSVAADLYALGVLGYLLLTGTLPFDGHVVEILMAHLARTPDPLAARRREPVDASLERLVLRAMRKAPAARHGSAAAFRTELGHVLHRLELGRRRTPSGTIG